MLVQLHLPSRKENNNERKKMENKLVPRYFHACPTQQSNGGAGRGSTAMRDAATERDRQ